MNTQTIPPKTKSTAGGRSFTYPALALAAAIERARQFWDKEKKHSAPVASAIECWGYGAKSSGGRLAISALLNFGLLEDSGTGDERQVKITERALTILHDPDENNRAKAISEAASAPRIYAELLSKYGSRNLPSDSTIKYFLLKEKNMNANSIDAFIKNFKETTDYANQNNSDNIPTLEENSKNNIINETESMTSENELPSLPQLPGSMKQDTFSLDEGQAILKWPSNMTASSFEDFKSWLELQIRKISRSVTQEI